MSKWFKSLRVIFKKAYQGTGKNYVNKRTTCSTLKDYLEVNSGKPSNEITLKECKEWAQNESSLEWKGEKTDWGNFPTGCSVYRYPGYEKLGYTILMLKKKSSRLWCSSYIM